MSIPIVQFSMRRWHLRKDAKGCEQDEAPGALMWVGRRQGPIAWQDEGAAGHWCRVQDLCVSRTCWFGGRREREGPGSGAQVLVVGFSRYLDVVVGSTCMTWSSRWAWWWPARLWDSFALVVGSPEAAGLLLLLAAPISSTELQSFQWSGEGAPWGRRCQLLDQLGCPGPRPLCRRLSRDHSESHLSVSDSPLEDSDLKDTYLIPRNIMAEPDYIDDDNPELIRPQKLVNPVKTSRNHQDLHRELLMNQKR